MFGSKFLITLIGIMLAIFAICNVEASPPVVENWWNLPAMTTTAVPVAKVGNQKVALGGNYFNPGTMGSNKFVSVPSFQAMLSPRFDNVQYGANIRYNLPDNANMAAPCDPLTFGSMAKENFTTVSQLAQEKSDENVPDYIAKVKKMENAEKAPGGIRPSDPFKVQGVYYVPPTKPPGAAYKSRNEIPARPVRKEGYCSSGNCSSLSCGKGGYGMGHTISSDCDLPAGYTNGNFQDVYDSLPGEIVSTPCTDDSSADLPIGTMSAMDGVGNQEQVVVYDRYMVTNMKSRNRGLGDPIRGDLPITPCQMGWFSVYPTINTDLQPGAMSVLAGEGNVRGSYQDLMNLLVSASGGAQTTFGGGNVMQTTQVAGSAVQGMGGAHFTAFP